MCRLYAFRSNEPTKVECSLIYAQNALLEQTRGDSTGRRRADGWGIVCYDGTRPTLHRRAKAVLRDAHFSRTAQTAFAETVVAHVRFGSVGLNESLNTHPFSYDRWTFAHSGTIPRFENVQRAIESRIATPLMDSRLGTTDSELYFLWLASHLMERNLLDLEDDRVNEALEVIHDAVAELADLCACVAAKEAASLSFVMTNGAALFALRWNNVLYQLVRQGVYDCEICGVPHVKHTSGVEYQAVVVASEPITNEKWTQVPDHSLLAVTPDFQCITTPIKPFNRNLQMEASP